MNHYDIVFMGHLGVGTIVPFKGVPFTEPGGPVFFACIGASCQGKKIGAVTRLSENDAHLLEALKSAGIDVFVIPGEVCQYRIVFPTANFDQREVFIEKEGGDFFITDMPPVEPCLVHLCLTTGPGLQLELLRELKARGFRLSVDMQGFVLLPDDETGIVDFADVPEKKEIVSMADFVKLDALEAQTLTGTDVIKDQADILESWGSSETVITSSEGAQVRSKGETTFVKFTNSSTRGRMGRGDTLIGSYLVRRLDHSIEDSLRFAVAVTSLKLESTGPFRGSMEDVFERMEESVSF